MKKVFITAIMATLFLVLVAYFTKPTDAEIITEALERYSFDTVLSKRIFYNSVVFGDQLGDDAITKGLMIEDKMLYKTISLNIHNDIQRVGTARFGAISLIGWNDPFLKNIPQPSIFDTALRHATIH